MPLKLQGSRPLRYKFGYWSRTVGPYDLLSEIPLITPPPRPFYIQGSTDNTPPPVLLSQSCYQHSHGCHWEKSPIPHTHPRMPLMMRSKIPTLCFCKLIEYWHRPFPVVLVREEVLNLPLPAPSTVGTSGGVGVFEFFR